jgi:hypothetical protein
MVRASGFPSGTPAAWDLTLEGCETLNQSAKLDRMRNRREDKYGGTMLSSWMMRQLRSSRYAGPAPQLQQKSNDSSFSSLHVLHTQGDAPFSLSAFANTLQALS